MKMNKVKLGDILDVKRGASIKGEFYATEGDMIRLTLGNFNYPGGGFKPNTSKDDIYYTGPVRDEFIMSKGDIITPLTEQVAGLLGETARIPESGKYIQNGDIGKVIPNEEKLDNSYAYYLMASPSIKRQLGAAAQQTKIRHTSPDKIKDCVAWLPTLDYQYKAGKLLDSINDKIANNNAISKQLEEAAKTIYDYWFLQFDFPDENGNPYRSSGGKMVWNDELKREIPEGWEAKKMTEFLELLKDGTHNPPKRLKKGIPLLTGKMFGRNFLDYSNATFIDKKEYEKIHSTYKPKEGDIIITKIGTIGNVNILRKKDIPIAIHCNSALLRYKKEFSYTFGFFMTKSDLFQARLKAVKGKSIQEFVSLNKIDQLIMECPPNAVIQAFNSKINCILKRMEKISIENDQLLSLRDFLLPMLMNGQVTFKEG